MDDNQAVDHSVRIKQFDFQTLSTKTESLSHGGGAAVHSPPAKGLASRMTYRVGDISHIANTADWLGMLHIHCTLTTSCTASTKANTHSCGGRNQSN